MTADPDGASPSAATGIDPLQSRFIIKRDNKFEWPENEKIFYVISKDGMFVCRDHPFFRSCTRVHRIPRELKPQKRFFVPKFPKLPGIMLDNIVGWFQEVYERYKTEAVALLVWDSIEKCPLVVVPPQITHLHQYGISKSLHGGDVTYEPLPLAPHLSVYGDIHSHMDFGAYSSYTDEKDEEYRPGLHIVVGKLKSQKPEFHVEAVVDSERFDLSMSDAFDRPFHQRRYKYANQWIEKLDVKISKAEGWCKDYWK